MARQFHQSVYRRREDTIIQVIRCYDPKNPLTHVTSWKRTISGDTVPRTWITVALNQCLVSEYHPTTKTQIYRLMTVTEFEDNYQAAEDQEVPAPIPFAVVPYGSTRPYDTTTEEDSGIYRRVRPSNVNHFPMTIETV